MMTHTWDSWISRFRDVIIVTVGGFMLVYETVVVASPNAYIIGAGLVALGLPPALRLDLRSSAERRANPRRRTNDRGHRDDDPDDDLAGWGGG
jgi:hypothetical protein